MRTFDITKRIENLSKPHFYIIEIYSKPNNILDNFTINVALQKAMCPDTSTLNFGAARSNYIPNMI